jgi:hypothetical protein
MRWLWPDYVNRALPLSVDQRRAIHRDAWKLWAARKRNIALYLTLPAFYLLVVWFASDAGGRLASLLGVGGSGRRLLRAAAPLLLFVLCFVVGGAVLQRWRFAPCVHRATRQHGYEVCVRCGYWLRGLGPDVRRCPECGERREPIRGGAPPR